jgi:uncharacterized protein
MSLIRLIFLLLLIWIVWFLIKNYLVKLQREMRNSSSTPGQAGSTKSASAKLPQKIVKCRVCEVHLPEDAALEFEDDWFCGREHQQTWLEKR